MWPREVQLAVEVRHLDWFSAPYHEQLNALLRAHDAARVLIDTRPIRDLPEAKVEGGKVQVLMEQAQERKPDVPLLPERTASFAFVRYIGNPDVGANAELLDEWADTNGVLGSTRGRPSLHSATVLMKRTRRRSAANCINAWPRARTIDPLPWDQIGRDDLSAYTQASLF